MRALLEQIEELDENEVYGRVVGVRGLMVEVAGPLHAMSVGSRVVIETQVQGRLVPIPCEVVGFSGGHALLMPFAPLEGVRRGCRAVVSSVRAAVRPSPGLARAGGQCHGRADRRQGPAAVGPAALSVPGVAAGGPCPPAGRRPDRPRRARAQHLHHLLPRPAHGHLLGLRRRQIGAAVDAGAQRRGRRRGDRADRRTRPRGPGVPAGRSGRGRAWPGRSWWWRPPTSRR